MVLGVLFLLFAIPQGVSAYDGADPYFKVTDVTFYDGSCEICGYFSNSGDMAAEMTKIELSIDVKLNGEVLFTVTQTFDLNQLYVWGGAPYKTFSIDNNSFKSKYNGDEYGWTVNKHWWWKDVKPIGM